MEGFLDISRQFGRDLTCKENNRCDVEFARRTGWLETCKKKESKNYKIKMSDFDFAVASQFPRMQLGRQRGNHRLVVGVRGKIGDKCLVMRLRFTVIREFCF